MFFVVKCKLFVFVINLNSLQINILKNLKHKYHIWYSLEKPDFYENKLSHIVPAELKMMTGA